MMRLFFIFLSLLMTALCYGRQIEFVTKDNQPIPEVTGVGYTAAGDSVGSWVSDSKGIMKIGNDGVDRIVASHPGYSDRLVFLDKQNAGQDRVVLSPAVDLKEVVVTPTDVEEFDTHTSYRISQKDMARYANVLQSLNEIPNMTVLTNGSMFFEGSENVKILIDGVDASTQELQSLSKEDISKVDVYRTPPLRFLAQGVSAVVDIRLKSRIHGGNLGLNISQAFQSLIGRNSAYMFYNYRQSRFTLAYTNENTHLRKFRKSETLDYNFGGVDYKKEKKGRDSKFHRDENALNLAYQINQPGNFLYNVKAAVAFNRDGNTSHQDVTANQNSFKATNTLRTDYTKYTVGNYFEKSLGDGFGTFLANVNYQHYSTYYNSAYNELFDGPGAVNDSHSRYQTNLDAVFSELQYQMPYSRSLGQFMACVYGNYKRSRYVDATTPFHQSASLLGGAVQWTGSKGTVRWYLSMGVDWNRTSSALREKAYDVVVPSPLVNMVWRPGRNLNLTLDYSYGSSAPSIAQLSQTEQWLDTRLVYHGNPLLRPYKTHSAGIRLAWNFRYLNLSFRGGFSSSPGRICDMYTETDRYMLQTLVNLSRYREWRSTIDLTVKPLGSNLLTFWNRVNLADLNGRNNEYSWHGHRFQWMSNLALNLDHWTVALFYQYPGKVVEGQLERPRAQCWYATVLYRPNTNLSVGFELFMPFGKGFKDSEYTVNEAPVHADTRYTEMDRNNLVSLKLSYNFSFGRNRNQATPQFDNGDNDTGILRK